MSRLTGTGVGTGAGTGPVCWLDDPVPVGEDTEDTVDVERARERFDAARESALAELQAEQSQAAAAIGAPGEDVLATHESFLTDPALEERVDEELEAGAPVARAVATAIEDWIEVFEAQGGRTAARADDLRDLRGRLLRALAGTTRHSIQDTPDGAVVLTTSLSPSDAALLDPGRVAGIASVHGSSTGHAAILARATGVPMVVDTGPDLHQFAAGDVVTVDADRGVVHDDPDGMPPEDVEWGTAEDGTVTQSGPAVPVQTAAGRRIRVGANVGSSHEAALAARAGANGIVLFRSEVLAYQHDGVPDADAQTQTYREALDAFPAEEVVIRTFDFGGDKLRPDADGDWNEGVRRGIERSLARPAELDTQLDALCRASDGGEGSLVVLLPHVTSVEQVDAARERLDDAASRMGVDTPPLGAMVETPAAVALAPDLAAATDRLAIGTNDLLAGLRGESREVPGDPDPLTPAFLRALVRTADAALDAGVPLSCCGELARDDDWAPRFVALGVDTLGVPPRDVARIRDGIGGSAVVDLRERVREAARASTKSEVRRRLSGGEHG